MKNIHVKMLFLLVALISTSNVLAAKKVVVSSGTVITTQMSRFTLTPLERIPSEDGLKSAGRTAEIATGELISDIEKLANEATALKKEMAEFDEIKKRGQEAIDEIKSKYDKQRNKYEDEVRPLIVETLAYNSLPESQRDEATHNLLALRKVVFDEKRARVEEKRVVSEQEIGEIVAKVNAVHDSLQARLVHWDNVKAPTLGLAYRQLVMCVDYANRVKTILNDRFPVEWSPEGKHPGYNSDGNYPILDKAMETIKALSGSGFDTK